MKKTAIFSALALSVFLFSSCDKAEKLLFQPFESPLNFNVQLAKTENVDIETSLGTSNVSFNLDEEVKAQTDGKVDGDVVGAMYIREVAIALQDPDQDNNLANFEYVTLSVTSGSATPVVFGPFAIPDGVTNSASFVVPNSPNVKSFFNGTNVLFELRGKAKTPTTRALNAQVSATMKFDK